MSVFRSSGDLAADRRYLWAEASLKTGDAAGAADLYAQAVEIVPEWAVGWFALGDAQERAGDAAAARLAFGRALALDAADSLGASVRLARMNGISPDLPPAYVAGLFDAYADRFDTHLTEALAYRGPALLVAALDAVAGPHRRFASALDLGCGTGLMAQALAGRAVAVDGIDLSPRMLEIARARGLYRQLDAGDVVEIAVQRSAKSADLVLAADVLVYLGDVLPLFQAVARLLTDDGMFAFTVQALETGSFALGADLRFAHSALYLHEAAAAAGLHIAYLHTASTRKDAGVDVPGLVVILQPE